MKDRTRISEFCWDLDQQLSDVFNLSHNVYSVIHCWFKILLFLRSGGRVHSGRGTRGLRPSLKSWAPRLPLTSLSLLLDSGGEDGAGDRQRGPAGGPGCLRPVGFPASGGAAAAKAAHELGTAHQPDHGLSQAGERRG